MLLHLKCALYIYIYISLMYAAAGTLQFPPCRIIKFDSVQFYINWPHHVQCQLVLNVEKVDENLSTRGESEVWKSLRPFLSSTFTCLHFLLNAMMALSWSCHHEVRTTSPTLGQRSPAESVIHILMPFFLPTETLLSAPPVDCEPTVPDDEPQGGPVMFQLRASLCWDDSWSEENLPDDLMCPSCCNMRAMKWGN